MISIASIIFFAPLIILAILAVAAMLGVKVAANVLTIVGKFVARHVPAFVILLILMGDIVAGRMQYEYLCATESGIRINKRVTLEPEYRSAVLPENPLAYNRTPLGKRYPYDSKEIEDLLGPGKIKWSQEMVRDAATGEVLGSVTMYFWGGGWVENAITTAPGAGGGHCGHKQGGLPELLKEILGVPR